MTRQDQHERKAERFHFFVPSREIGLLAELIDSHATRSFTFPAKAPPRGRAALDRNIPALRKNPNYFLFQGFSLRQLAEMSGGKITQAKLEGVRADLASTSPAH